jgi:energy-coupling factor transporter ATP-binding protein EcfA2
VRDTADGPVTLLQDINFTLRRGEWIGLLGPNGSGKTSLLRWLAGEESPLDMPRGYVFQDPDEQIIGATVKEELSLGRPPGDHAALLSLYGLDRQANLDPRLLSAGEKQRLAVAVAMSGGPQVLLCDEPTTLQDARHGAWLRQHLLQWRQQTDGSLVLSTQRRTEAELCDRLLVLQGGRIVAAGVPETILSQPQVIDMLAWPERPRAEAAAPVGPVTGQPATGRVAEERRPAGEPPAAEWRAVAYYFAATGRGFRGVDLTIPPGARVGITGPNGCGKSTLLALAVGLLRPLEGSCLLGGRPLAVRKVPDLDHGLALLAPQFPEYLFTRTSVRGEVALDPALAALATGQLLDRIGLPSAYEPRNPHELSSGQKRRLALALVLHSRRPLLLLDEPTAGLDGEGRRRVIAMLADLPNRTALVIASHDVDFLISCGCTVYVLGPDGLCPHSGAS